MSAGKVLPAVALVLLLALAWGCFRLGVITQRKADSDARLRLAVQVDSARQAHAAELAALNVEMVSRGTALALAESRATAAEARAQYVRNDVFAARDSLNASQTMVDSLRAYPPLVDALTRQVEAVDSARVGYRDALAASQERSGLLLRRIAADSLLIERQDAALAKIIPPPPPPKSRWACVGGVGAVTGARTGLGVGVTCGRTL